APGDTALVDQIFRSVHTVKGTSGFLSLEQLSELAHHFEDVLNKLRRGDLAVRPGTVDVLLRAYDLMRVLVQQVADRQIEPVDLSATLAELDAVAAGLDPAPSVTAPEPLEPATAAPNAPPPDVEPPKAEAAKPTGKGAGHTGSTETIRVGVDRLDALMDLVGELVLSRNRLLQLLSSNAVADARGGAGASDDLLGEVRSASAHLDFLTGELQAAVMQTRMVPIGRVFAKFPRMVRDLAAACGKEVDLVLEGEETELDKSLTEDLADPLVHLVRNAVDHGIEPPEARAAAGKPRRGRVRLAAAHEGDHILVAIEDDGGGIAPEAITQKAVERGLVTAQEAAELSDSEALQLIFRPGLSTAEAVSQVSGRGVGMDVVKTNLTRLNGSISIASTPGEGTRFTLKLPLTLAIIQGLLVRAGAETFVVPLHAVDEVLDLAGDRACINGRAVMRHRDGIVPLLGVAEALGARPADEASGTQYAVLVRVGHRRVGLVVDALVSQQEVVIKPLGDYLKKPPSIAGSTILGDGRVVMVLDLGQLVGRRVAADAVL
ncbi:MAG: chemotaxis protein CheA, partial [Rhodothermales bacterium]|nr:chemotaxis protein CheA [Rhodothermales bacterium]